MEDKNRIASLVRAAQKGDDASFAALVTCYQDVVVAYATSILHDYHLAEDAAQEAFVEAHRQLRSLREPSAFGAWLRTIVFKYCDRIKRRKQHIITGLDAASGFASSARSPHDKLESREIDRSVWNAVAALSQKEQTVILLYYVGEHSHSAIAEFLGVTANTVKTRLYSARRRLREFITDRLEEKLISQRPSGNQIFARRVMTATLSLQLYYLDRNGRRQTAGSTVAARTPEVPKADTWLIEPPQDASERDWKTVLRLIKEMKVPGIGAHQVTDKMLERISHQDHLTYLDLSGSPITDEGLKQLARLPHLRHLNLSCPFITDKGLEVLRRLLQLGTIEISHQHRITDAGIANLAHCDQLEDVNLMGTRTGDGAIRSLTGKSRLSRFFGGTNVTDAGLALFHEFPVFKKWRGGKSTMSLMEFTTNPNYLWLNLKAPLTNNGLANLAGLEGLSALNLFATTGHSPFDDHESLVTAAGLRHLADLSHLGWLGCNAQLCTDEAMSQISDMPRLRFLMCQDAIAGDEGFAALAQSQTIEYIWGRRCHSLTGRGFAALSAMPALRGLSVSCKNVDADGLSTLPDFPALKEFMPMDVPDAGFRHIGLCEDLESLHCMYCQDTTDASTEHIASLKKLKTYQAWSTQITDRSLEILGKMPSLEHLGLYDCTALTNTGVGYLAHLPKLRTVDLKKLPHLTPEGVTVFPARVRVNYSA